ncbi:MAG: bifunctional hydroxymethylpyrimidine kinase/phosphomethylpyrimidine kinase [Candidatus Eremiobacteraeota bacterium]|nr:bifunctional hydroxymethylpyrimidine kinase/phosphomethylpyrimidine kinase [Candidatus Eremiobacteraeota bacterium]
MKAAPAAYHGDGAWLPALLKKMRGRRIAVVGDLMLDEWLWGAVRRISPEAPVPVVEVSAHSYTLGGAGNVANNLAALGAEVSIIGAIGDDDSGAMVLDLCRRLGAATQGIVPIRSRPTTRKTRIVAHGQQVVRADRECTDPIDDRSRSVMMRAAAKLEGKIDGIIVSDYGKGLISVPLVEAFRALRRTAVITGDPKPQNIDAFADVDCIAPNAAEVEIATGISVKTDSGMAQAASSLLRRTGCRYVLVTRGEHGMTLFSDRQVPFTAPSVARQVYDVSGAGDTVISTLTLALAVGAPIERAVALATVAAGVVVEKLGTATASAQEIERFAGGVIVDLKPAPSAADKPRAAKRRGGAR